MAAVLKAGRTVTGPAAARRLVLRVTRRTRMVPDYLVIGVKRGGSTSLQAYLAQHPDVLPPYVAKGSRYFDVNHGRGPAWFASHFPSVATADRHEARRGRRPRTGEASPYYVFHPAAPGRIARDLPEARLIVVVRDPVERAWSHHRYEVARGFEPLAFRDALDAEEERLRGEHERLLVDPDYRSFSHRHHSYLARGRYAEQLQRLFEVVPREQVLVLASEHLFADPSGTMQRVFRFLDLAPWSGIDGRPHKANDVRTLPDEDRAHVRTYFAAHDEQLFRLLDGHPGWTAPTTWADGSP